MAEAWIQRARAAAALLGLCLAACGGQDRVELSVPLSQAGSLDGNGSELPKPPNTAAGRQLSWLLQALNHDVEQLSAREIQRHFEASLLNVLPSEQILAEFSALARDQAPLTFREVSPDTSEMSLLALIDGSRSQLTIGMNIQEHSGKISGYQFTPLAEPEPPPVASWQGVQRALTGVAPRAQYMVARVAAGSCQVLHGFATDQRLALGTSSSLYVLAELARQISAGTLGWDTPIVIQDALKSLPSGDLQDAPPGTALSVRDVATKMIAIGDNTATDHLIHLLGRENIEAEQAAVGHQAPELNMPFLATRELFLFRLELASAETDNYLSQVVSARRAFLDELAGRSPRAESANGWFLPRRIDQLEWFASADELCPLMASLDQRGEEAALRPLREVLSRDPGLPIDAAEFPYVAFKGGSEPGVLNLTWLVERRDGERFFVTIGLNDPSAPILDIGSVMSSALDIFQLLGSTD
ncbi:MAG TPA: serine hydrolase [Polyangiaceae bacterium]|nr:serine hydrolase [Polyangiaceae bacterium]